MGKTWDTGETAFDPTFWVEVLRVMKPGAHLIAFSGTRTYHRLACAIEDAGFEIRDMVSWIYGSGFPKSHDVAKGIDKAELNITRGRAGRQGTSFGQEYERTPKGNPISDNAKIWNGWGTALKPALEPIVLARKPMDGTVAGNCLKHGVGALNIDGCRVGVREKPKVTYAKSTSNTYGKISSPGGKLLPDSRWPANVVHDGSDEVTGSFPSAPGQLRAVGPSNGSKDSVNVYGDYGPRDQFDPRGDEGSAARFFYSAKADAEDRMGSKHPTVKPVDLMAYLVRLVTPAGGIVLDPFAGSGTTGLAAMREGCDCILIEREAEYVADIERRLAWARGEGRLTAQEMNRKPSDAAGGLPLFAEPAA